MMTTDRADKWRTCASTFRNLFYDQQIDQVDPETLRLAEELFRGLVDLETWEAGDL
jgi:hypothetical protein